MNVAQAVPAAPAVTHGVRSNLGQILLLVAVNAFVGAMIGVERAILPLLAGREFGIQSVLKTTSFIISFGITKAFTNLFAGRLADRIGRKTVLVLGWAIAIPVPLIVMHARSWEWVVFANVLLAVNQGLCWTLTLLMKIDLGGPKRRGFAAGINETIGYGCVALAALAATEIANKYGLRPYPFYIGLGAAILGLLAALFFVRETRDHADKEHVDEAHGARPSWREIFERVTFRDRSLFAAAQAGFVRNLADGMAWGLLLLMFAKSLDQHLSQTLSWILVAFFAIGQFAFGSLSDAKGRKPFIAGGMMLIAASLGLIAATRGFAIRSVGLALLGIGGSLMYPTVIASLSDQMGASWRASGIGAYRFWRDMGYAAGALLSGAVATRFGMEAAVLFGAALRFVSGVG